MLAGWLCDELPSSLWATTVAVNFSSRTAEKLQCPATEEELYGCWGSFLSDTADLTAVSVSSGFIKGTGSRCAGLGVNSELKETTLDLASSFISFLSTKDAAWPVRPTVSTYVFPLLPGPCSTQCSCSELSSRQSLRTY